MKSDSVLFDVSHQKCTCIARNVILTCNPSFFLSNNCYTTSIIFLIFWNRDHNICRKKLNHKTINLFLIFWNRICVVGESFLYITQSSLPISIYVQNLSFLVTQILTFNHFFCFWHIYMIFMGDREKVWYFMIPRKKGWNLKFSKKVKILKKSSFFKKFTLCVFLLPFMYFFEKNIWITSISRINVCVFLVKSTKKTLTKKNGHLFWRNSFC